MGQAHNQFHKLFKLFVGNEQTCSLRINETKLFLRYG